MAGSVRAAVGVAKGQALTDDKDVYRSAKLLIDRHGNDAVIEAAMMADKMLKAGDLDGLATWNRILRAIEE